MGARSSGAERYSYKVDVDGSNPSGRTLDTLGNSWFTKVVASDNSHSKQLPSSFDLFDKTVNIFKEKYQLFIGITAIPVILNIIIALITPDRNNMTNTIDSIDFLILPLSLLYLVATIASSIATLYAIPSKTLTISEAYKKTPNKILPYFAVLLLAGLAVFGGFLLLIIPGIILLVWFSLATYTLVFENTGIVESFKKSKQYVTGLWFAVFGKIVFLVFFFIGTYLVLGILSTIFGIRDMIVLTILDSLVSLIITPLGIIFMYLVYKNVKEIQK